MTDPFAVPTSGESPAPPGTGPSWAPPPYAGYQPYGQPMGQWGPPVATGTNGLAIASLVLGIIPFFGVGAIVAIVFGVIARKQTRISGQGGHGMALAGIILGSLWVLLFVILIVVIATTGGGHACFSSGTGTCGTSGTT